jgi:WD domain, G-beta repeat
VNTAAFSGDGTRVVTASWDGTARIWDAESGKEIALLKGHTGVVSSAAFSASSRLIDLNGETNSLKRKKSSAIIAVDVRRFGHAINRNEVSGTRSLYRKQRRLGLRYVRIPLHVTDIDEQPRDWSSAFDRRAQGLARLILATTGSAFAAVFAPPRQLRPGPFNRTQKKSRDTVQWAYPLRSSSFALDRSRHLSERQPLPQ